MRLSFKLLLAFALLTVPALSYAQDSGAAAGHSKKSKTKAAKVENLDVYMFGAAYSMIDSVLVISDIQRMEQVRVSNKWFLTDRKDFESQFDDYVSQQYGTSALAFVTFSPKEKPVLKQRERLIRKARKKSGYTLSYPGSAFHFTEALRYRID